MVNGPTVTVAAMVADLMETKRIHGEGNRLKNRKKQMILLMIKCQQAGSIKVSCKLVAISDIIRDPKRKFKRTTQFGLAKPVEGIA